MNTDHVMDSSDSETNETTVPASSQLTATQVHARTFASDYAADIDHVQWQNSQSANPALKALINKAAEPVSRPRRKTQITSAERPPVPLFSEASSSKALPSHSSRMGPPASTTRAHPRNVRHGSAKYAKLNSGVPLEEPKDFFSMLKTVSAQVDQNAREKMKWKGLQEQQTSRRHSDPVTRRPRNREPQAPTFLRAKTKDKGSVRAEALDRQGSGELLDQTNIGTSKGKGTAVDQSAAKSSQAMISATSASFDNDDDTCSMDVDIPLFPRIDTTGSWNLSQMPQLVADTSDVSSASASTPSTPTNVPQHSQTPITTSSEPTPSPPSRAVQSSSTLSRSTSAPQSNSVYGECPIDGPSTSSAPSSQATARYYPPQYLSHTTVDKPQGLPHDRSVEGAHSSAAAAQPPRLSQRPPALGMRRTHNTTSFGITPSQSLPTRQRPFKPPLARPHHTKPPSQLPSRLPTPNPSPPPPPRRVPSPPAPAEADSSYDYGDMSIDMDALDAEMSKYD